MMRIFASFTALPRVISLCACALLGCGTSSSPSPASSSGSPADVGASTPESPPVASDEQPAAAERPAAIAPEPAAAKPANSAPPARLSWTWKGANGAELAVTDGKIELETVYFHTNKPTLHQRSQTTIDQLAAFLEKHVEITGLRIEGHTDSRGSNAYNLRLSAVRAHAIARALVARGIECGRLQPVGYGETRPISGNKTNVGRHRNRRMEFRIANLGDRTLMPALASSETAGYIAYDPCVATSSGAPAQIAH